MNRITTFLNNQYGISNDCSYDFALKRLAVAKEDSWRGISPSNYSSDYNPEPPIFSAKFANCEGYRHILAIANEDGKIALQDTTKRNKDLEEKALNGPQCHFNAVFDLDWAPGQMKFVSASGDHTARLWEVVDGEIRSVRSFAGHTRSVKTAAFRKSDASVFATGGRDGAILIWDTRANLNVDLTPRADNCIFSGHLGGPGTPVSQRKRTRTPKLVQNNTSSSITGLAFQDTNTIISCGAGDGVIKVWDLRRNYTTYKKEPQPKHSLPYAGTYTFKGFTNLLIDESGTRLYANCMDNTIYCYNLCSYDPKPLACYKGLLNSTFYIKSCLSPDGKYLLSGSSDEKAYIWNLNYADEPLVSLSGHTVEVTCVAWGSTHDHPIVTCSDDARHKIWRIGPECLSETERAEWYRGRADYVRRFEKRQTTHSGATHKYNLRDLESTPRSLKRLVDQNERTPGSVEKVPAKRSFLEMLGATNNIDGGDEQYRIKRVKTLESRGRRLFSPSTSAVMSCSSSSGAQPRCLSLQLTVLPEERSNSNSTHTTSPLSRSQFQQNDSNQENTTAESSQSSICKLNIYTPSPLTERISEENLNYNCHNTPPTPPANLNGMNSHQLQTSQSVAAGIFSPTSNLPNFVIDGEAPHLTMSPKRKLKDKVDWLTKIRKQKLMSSCRSTTLTEKKQEDCLASPRLQRLRQSEAGVSSGPHLATAAATTTTTPSRRNSHHTASSWQSSSNELTMSPSSAAAPKTPTSSRRNSETTILRFFSIQSPIQQRTEDFVTSSTTEMHSLQPLASLSTVSTTANVFVSPYT